MVVSKKDKSFILLLVSSAIVLWCLFLLFSYLFSVASVKSSNVFDPFVHSEEDKRWFNLSKKLTKEDFEGKVVILDFWTYSCVQCLKNIEQIKKIEQRFGDELLVLGVHSGKFENEKDPKAIKEAVIKYDITHPVVDDSNLEIFNSFEIRSWPTLVLISPKGRIEKVYEGVENYEKLSRKIAKLIKRDRYVLSKKPLSIVLEKNKVSSNVLNFPSKIEYAKNFVFKKDRVDALVISNSRNNSIFVAATDGQILETIGTKEAGFKDGSFKDARFNFPTGLLYQDNILYVADRGNNAIRKVDFKSQVVSTIIGDGEIGGLMEGEIDVKNARLSAPNDLEYFPDKNHIVIANVGTSQILKYDIKNNKLSVLAGNGSRKMVDGKYPDHSLAQPSGMQSYNQKLYFVDAYSSSLRVVDKNGVVKTLIGQGVNKFGNVNGGEKVALMQNPLGIFVDHSGVYVADTYNHLIRRYDHSSKNLSNYSGNGSKGSEIGEVTSYSDVSDLISINRKFYILDSHNNRIVVKNRDNGKTSLLDILPRLRLPQDGLLEYLPNLEKLEDKIVKSDSAIDLMLSLSDGWKINEKAPSFFNIVKVLGIKEASLIASYDWNMVKSGKIILPKMSSKYKYYLQGTVYYCEDKKNALCFIHSYESKILPKKSSNNQSIEILL